MACAGALLSGCLGDEHRRAQVDPTSPIAAEVAKTAHQNQDFPSFAEIPAKPSDVRPLRQFGRAADEITQAGLNLERDTAPGTWTLNGSDAFAAGAQRAAGPTIAAPNPADTDAFVREQRRRATPPPPPKR